MQNFSEDDSNEFLDVWIHSVIRPSAGGLKCAACKGAGVRGKVSGYRPDEICRICHGFGWVGVIHR